MTAQQAAIVINGTYEVSDEDRARFVALVRSNLEYTVSVAGNVYYSFATDLLNENLFRMAEAWTSREALDEYMASAEFAQTLAELAEIKSVRRTAVVFSVSGQDGIELPTG
ncbi:MAG: putative quinol monooxygenase [Pseudonocardia sp.]